jgi:hypothetical protein
MHSGNDKKGFKEQAEQWRHENTDPCGARLLSEEEAKFDDHRGRARNIKERTRQSEQSGGSVKCKKIVI